ncbi:hypothetical protein [Taklimakanibacter lacteus]|uniref:hypothetical protein n=1 Tax=Taklimakanibacter lacteus TaxID=2268456 RepID=UPI000E674A56
MSRIDELEAEADRRRADFARSLRKVRRKLTPLGLADEALRQLDPRRQAVAAAGRSLRRNPLPVIPVLLGLSWLALDARRPRQAKAQRIRRKARSLIATQKKEVPR